MKDAYADAAQCKHKRWNAKDLKKTDAGAEADAEQCKRIFRLQQNLGAELPISPSFFLLDMPISAFSIRM